MMRLLKSRGLLVALVAALIPVFLAVVVTVGQILLSTGVLIPDFHFGYSASDLGGLLERMGADGRRLFARVLWLDWLNPALYTLVLGVGLARLDAPRWQFLVPLLAGLLDYAENTASRLALSVYPDAVPGWGGLVSPVKHLALVAALFLVWRALRRS